MSSIIKINIHLVQTWKASQKNDGIDNLCLLTGLVQFIGILEEFLTKMQCISIYRQDGLIMQKQGGLAERKVKASI